MYKSVEKHYYQKNIQKRCNFKETFSLAKSFLFWHKCQNSPSKMRLHGKSLPFSVENVLGSALKPQFFEKN